jgi:Putative transposase/Transposase zinc-binding domain
MTEGHRLEVADVFRQHGEAYLAQYGASPEQQRVLHNIRNCRTAALGGHVQECDSCGHRKISYNSCRNRHCPKCQGSARARWLEARAAELLPVPYFHVVFTLPENLGPLALQNKMVVYGLLFQAVAETLLEVAANPKRMGARLGFLAVLHTWGQNLMHHPHIHCVVPSGGLSLDGTAWVSGRKKFLLPVRVLSRVFRGKFISFLKRAHARGELKFHGQLRCLSQSATMENLLNYSVKHEWVVYAKRPFGGPAVVLKYLARYTHRVAISNGRLLRLENGQVTFRWKDYAHGSRQNIMNLEANEFIRRFLLHVLPSGFVRIRYYGFMANRVRAQNVERCRQLLGQQLTPEPEPLRDAEPSAAFDEDRCPVCHQGCMRIIERLRPQRAQPTMLDDTS